MAGMVYRRVKDGTLEPWREIQGLDRNTDREVFVAEPGTTALIGHRIPNSLKEALAWGLKPVNFWRECPVCGYGDAVYRKDGKDQCIFCWAKALGKETTLPLPAMLPKPHTRVWEGKTPPKEEMHQRLVELEELVARMEARLKQSYQ